MSSAHTILIVDDELPLRQTLAMILQHEGYLVTTASGAAEARQYLQAGPFDAVFLDLKMPEVDGLALLAEFRQYHPEMPILILTAHATLESAMEAVRRGARDYLLKPIDPEVIVARLNEVLCSDKLPRRRREITAQMQELLGELDQMDKHAPPVAETGARLPLNDTARFLKRGVFTLDLHTRRVMLNNEQILLPPSTFDYLVTLMRHSPNPVTYAMLVQESQGYSMSRAEAREMSRGRVHELRKALEKNMRHPEHIITVRDVGYRLVT
jgi:DNA-binding response OmpR family regulator